MRSRRKKKKNKTSKSLSNNTLSNLGKNPPIQNFNYSGSETKSVRHLDQKSDPIVSVIFPIHSFIFKLQLFQ